MEVVLVLPMEDMRGSICKSGSDHCGATVMVSQTDHSPSVNPHFSGQHYSKHGKIPNFFATWVMAHDTPPAFGTGLKFKHAVMEMMFSPALMHGCWQLHLHLAGLFRSACKTGFMLCMFHSVEVAPPQNAGSSLKSAENGSMIPPCRL